MWQFAGIAYHTCGGLTQVTAKQTYKSTIGAEAAGCAMGKHHTFFRQTVNIHSYVGFTAERFHKFSSKAFPYHK